MTNFVHLHVHTAYSMLEGAIKLDELARHAKAMKLPAVAMTDTNNLAGAYAFSKAMSEAGVQPIIGAQIELRFRDDETAPVVALAQSEAGYENLMGIVSAARLAASGAPAISVDGLTRRNEGIILLSGGWNGPFDRLIRSGEKAEARALASALQSYFGDRFYFELQRYGRPGEEEVISELLSIARSLGCGSVATVDAYYLTPDQREAHEALRCIAAGQYLDDTSRKELPEGHHLRSPEEMYRLFSDIPEALENSVAIAQRCHSFVEKAKPELPAFPGLEGRTEDEALRQEAEAGLESRLARIELSAEREVYEKRLAYEIEVIQNMGFSGYFLIVSDFIRWAKSNGIPVGPGRGSGAGSLVAYVLEITDLDPLRFGLLFERFLNPDRVSMPDFDIDFCQERRNEVIDYVRQRYGQDHVAQIGTIGKLQARAALRDVGRVVGLPYKAVDRFVRLIPNNPGKPVSLAEAVEMPDVKAEISRGDARVQKMFRIALKLEGLFRNLSTHAAGVVIANRPLLEVVPVYRDEHGHVVTQFDMKAVEDIGLVKFDFLGLKTLDVIQQSLDLAKANGNPVDFDGVADNDEPTYEMLAEGSSYGVFQLESAGMRDAMRRIQPSAIEDLVALVSLYRPGPMENIPMYATVKQGARDPEYPHPSLEPILRETNGIIVYQEQVMQIAQTMAGYTLAQADLLRRAMGKKIAAEMEKMRDIFADGAAKKGIDPLVAKQVFEKVAKFADYGFNKSHAACYAWLAFQTAYLRRHRPYEFITANLNIEIDNVDKVAEFFEEAVAMQLNVLGPDVNASDACFTIEPIKGGREDALRYGLAGIRACGQGAMRALVSERTKSGAYKNLDDLLKRLHGQINKQAAEALIRAGAMDCFSDNRAALLAALPQALAKAQSDAKHGHAQVSLFDAGLSPDGDVTELPCVAMPGALEMLVWEIQTMGMCVSQAPRRGWEQLARRQGAMSVARLKNYSTGGERRTVQVAGVVSDIEAKMSKAKKPFTIVHLCDTSGSMELALFGEVHESHRGLLTKGSAYLFDVEVSQRDDKTSYFVRLATPFEERMAA